MDDSGQQFSIQGYEMTIKETGFLEGLRDEIHDYHVDVIKQAMELKSVSQTVREMKVDLYGTPGDKAVNPGKLSEFSTGITDLRRSRKTRKIVLGGLWVVFTMVLGSLIGWLIRG